VKKKIKYMFWRMRATIDKLEKRILPAIQKRRFGPRAMQLFLVACALMAACVAITSFVDAANDPFKYLYNGPDAALIDNSSYNNSTIRFESQNDMINSPVSIAAGNGYYSSHPIAYGSKISSRTQIANKGTVASMQRNVDSANGLSGTAEFMAAESQYRQGDSEYISTTTTQMKIDEIVTEGKVHIGALKGRSASIPGPGIGGTDPLINAWKDPDLETEEDYIGTYHILRNMTINSSYDWKASRDSWLGCCLPDGYEIFMQDSRLPLASADEVFSYDFRKSAASNAKV
jgi:hypothetical protein